LCIFWWDEAFVGQGSRTRHIYYLSTEAVCLRVSGWCLLSGRWGSLPQIEWVGCWPEWVPCLKSEWVGCASNPYVHWYHIESNPGQGTGESLQVSCSTSNRVPSQFWTLIK